MKQYCQSFEFMFLRWSGISDNVLVCFLLWWVEKNTLF